MSADPFIGDVLERQERERKAGGRPRKDGRGRQRKLLCESCGFIAYASRGAVERAGVPVCGCGLPMVAVGLEELEIREEVAVRSFEESYHRGAARKVRGTRPDPKRCAAGGCTKFCRGEHCPDHELGNGAEYARAHR